MQQQEKIAEFLQTLRKAKGYTQQDVADYLGVSNKTVSKWETGQVLPDILTIKALAELYDISVDELLEGQKAKKDRPIKTEARDNLIINNLNKKINIFFLVSLIPFSIGLVISIILDFTGYNLIGFALSIFFILLTIIIYLLPNFLFNKEEIILVKENYKNGWYKIGPCLISFFIFGLTTLSIHNYFIVFAIIIDIALGFLLYLITKKYLTTSLFKTLKLNMLLISAALGLFTIFFILLLGFGISNGQYETLIIISYLIIYLIALFIGIITKGKNIIPSLLNIIITILVIIGISSVAYYTYYVHYIVINIILIIAYFVFMIIECHNLEIVKKTIVKLSIAFNIIPLILLFVILILSSVLPNNGNSLDTIEIVLIVILGVVGIITIFIPWVKFILPNIFSLIGTIYISGVIYVNYQNNNEVLNYNLIDLTNIFIVINIVLLFINILALIGYIIIKYKTKQKALN